MNVNKEEPREPSPELPNVIQALLADIALGTRNAQRTDAEKRAYIGESIITFYHEMNQMASRICSTDERGELSCKYRLSTESLISMSFQSRCTHSIIHKAPPELLLYMLWESLCNLNSPQHVRRQLKSLQEVKIDIEWEHMNYGIYGILAYAIELYKIDDSDLESGPKQEQGFVQGSIFTDTLRANQSLHDNFLNRFRGSPSPDVKSYLEKIIEILTDLHSSTNGGDLSNDGTLGSQLYTFLDSENTKQNKQGTDIKRDTQSLINFINNTIDIYITNEELIKNDVQNYLKKILGSSLVAELNWGNQLSFLERHLDIEKGDIMPESYKIHTEGYDHIRNSGIYNIYFYALIASQFWDKNDAPINEFQ